MLVRVEKVRKTYTIGKNTLPVLRGATFSVAAGERVAIIGKSGAGKSTLLHILGGLDRPDEGAIFFEGVDLYAQSPARRTAIRSRRIGFVFQSYHLLPEMDVLENVILPGLACTPWYGSQGPLRAKARELLDAVGLGERADHTPFELSGGEQQRVAIARALMNDPQLVFADEPTGNLDDATGGHVLDLLFRLAGGRGHALVMVTHNERIARCCDRVLRLTDGVLVEEPAANA